MHLILSHPPHAIEPDLTVAAPAMALAIPDARLKVHYPIPEIWRALPSGAEAGETLDRLRASGLRVVGTPGAALAAIPPQRPLVTFAFETDALVLFDEGEHWLAYDTPVIAVGFSPKQGSDRNQPSGFLDLYAMRDRHQLGRWTATRGTTDFAGIGDRRTASFGANALALLEQVEQHFTRVVLDRRLLNMQTRQRGVAPPPGTRRTGMSFGTVALDSALKGIDPALATVEHAELASRVAFLTQIG